MNTAACDLPRKSLMRSRVIWTMVASGVVLSDRGQEVLRGLRLVHRGSIRPNGG